MKWILGLATLGLTACATTSAEFANPQDVFFAQLKSLCGKNFEGRLVSTDPADADFAGKRLLARGVGCSANEVRIAFDVGEDKSRTWILTRTPAGIRLKHRHLLKDGSVDPVSNYGGDTMTPGTALRQEFPVDQESKDMFVAEGRTVSLTNVWAFEVEPGKALTYELKRPGRLFRVSFDLTRAVAK